MRTIKKKLYIKITHFNIFITFILIRNLSKSDNQCEYDSPIYKDSSCQLVYCTENQFLDGTCVIKNNIIKTQWMNNIIVFNDKKYRYCNFVINSKGDLIAEYSTEEKNGIRLFYVLKQNGNFYFKDSENTAIPTKKITVGDWGITPARSDSENILISLNITDDNNQYLISISYSTGSIELYDLDLNLQSFLSSEDFTGYNIYSKRSQLIELNINDNEKQYLHVFVGQIKNTNGPYDIVLHKYSFYSNIISEPDGYNIIKTAKIENVFKSRAVSAYINSKQIIIFYCDNGFYISIYDFDLNEKKNQQISNVESIDGNIGVFFKCIHLKNDLGAFFYYKNKSDYGPYLKIENIDSDYNIEEKFEISLITDNNFQSEPLLCDCLKINDNRFSFITASNGKSKLFVLLFDLYNNDKNIKVRIYKIYFLYLYQNRIFRDVTSILYNNYLTVSFSACDNLYCDFYYSNPNLYSLFMIFNYINGTDSFIDFFPYLIENKNDKNTKDINNNSTGTKFL